MSPGGRGGREVRLAVAWHICCSSPTHLQYGGHCGLYALVLYAACTSCIGGHILTIDANTATDGAAVAAATTVAIAVAVAVAVAREQRLDETLWTRRCLTHGQAQGSACG